MNKTETINFLCEYETCGHWLSQWIGFDWGQVLFAKYIAAKVRRKYKRLSYHQEMKKFLASK